MEGYDPNFYMAEISSLPEKWNKCRECTSRYAEKRCKFNISRCIVVYADNLHWLL